MEAGTRVHGPPAEFSGRIVILLARRLQVVVIRDSRPRWLMFVGADVSVAIFCIAAHGDFPALQGTRTHHLATRKANVHVQRDQKLVRSQP